MKKNKVKTSEDDASHYQTPKNLFCFLVTTKHISYY